MAGEIIGSIVQKRNASDSESEDGDHERGRVRGIVAPPSYALQFGSLESFEESCNIDVAAHCLLMATRCR